MTQRNVSWDEFTRRIRPIVNRHRNGKQLLADRRSTWAKKQPCPICGAGIGTKECKGWRNADCGGTGEDS